MERYAFLFIAILFFITPVPAQQLGDLTSLSIYGDAQLLEMAEQYGWPGNGTASNPIIISDLVIDASKATSYYDGSNLLMLRFTSLHVTVQNNQLLGIPGEALDSDYEPTSNGIYIMDCSNIRITNNTIKHVRGSGIYSQDSQNMSIETNLISNPYFIETDYGDIGVFSGGGIILENSSNIVIRDNDVIDYPSPLKLAYGGENVSIEDNRLTGPTFRIDYGSTDYGVLLGVGNITATNNSLMMTGFNIYDFAEVELANNTVNGKDVIFYRDQQYFALQDFGQAFLLNCSDVVITNFDIHNAYKAINLYNSSNIEITQGILHNNQEAGIYLLNCVEIEISNVDLISSIILARNLNGSVISSCNFYNHSKGIYLSNVRNALIEYNSFTNMEIGIYFDVTNDALSCSVTIRENTFENTRVPIAHYEYDANCQEIYNNYVITGADGIATFDGFTTVTPPQDPESSEFGPFLAGLLGAVIIGFIVIQILERKNRQSQT